MRVGIRGWLMIFLLGAVVGGAGGVALGFYLYPHLNRPAAPVEAANEAAVEQPVVARGAFIQADPADAEHHGSGRVTVRRDAVVLEPDFRVGPGPGYRVYLVPKANIRSATDIHRAMYVDLGPLQAFAGSQRYAIPDGVDLSKYPSVVIWSERFRTLISPADLVYGDTPAGQSGDAT